MALLSVNGSALPGQSVADDCHMQFHADAAGRRRIMIVGHQVADIQVS